MPQPQTTFRTIETKPGRFVLSAVLYGPIRPDRDLDRRTQRALKGVQEDQEFFTEITLRDTRQAGLMGVDFSVTASSPVGAERAGIVYLGQLCDVLSSITREPIKFLMPGEDSREERMRGNRASTHIDRILTSEEWNWVIGTLVSLRQKHPRYLAASSWYRKGLCGIDPLEVACCYWRVVERLSLSYSDKTDLPKDKEGRAICSAKNCVAQFVSQFGLAGVANGFLSNTESLKKVVELRNDVSHGNEPITPKLIEDAADFAKPLEEAAYESLAVIRSLINQPEGEQ